MNHNNNTTSFCKFTSKHSRYEEIIIIIHHYLVFTNVHIEFCGTATANIVGGIYRRHHSSNFHLTILLHGTNIIYAHGTQL